MTLSTTCAREGCGHPKKDHGALAGCTTTNDSGGYCRCPGFQPPAALPSTPYDQGTSSGHSGSETSHQRAKTEDANGTTAARQAKTLELLQDLGSHGATVKDLRHGTGWHHGQASASLSNLHHAGTVVRLAETRDRCKVYVLPQYVDGRPTEAHGTRGKPKSGRVVLTDDEKATLRRARLALGNAVTATRTPAGTKAVSVTLLADTAQDLYALLGRLA